MSFILSLESEDLIFRGKHWETKVYIFGEIFSDVKINNGEKKILLSGTWSVHQQLGIKKKPTKLNSFLLHETSSSLFHHTLNKCCASKIYKFINIQFNCDFIKNSKRIFWKSVANGTLI